jgi:excisionase family DNA binding protein
VSDGPLLLGVREAAHRLNVGRDTAYELVRSGRLRSIAVGVKKLIPESELVAFIERELHRDGRARGTEAASTPDVPAP